MAGIYIKNTSDSVAVMKIAKTVQVSRLPKRRQREVNGHTGLFGGAGGLST